MSDRSFINCDHCERTVSIYPIPPPRAVLCQVFADPTYVLCQREKEEESKNGNFYANQDTCPSLGWWTP